MAPAAIADFLAEHEARSTLRFVTCGSVDDGKSTLIGRLLYESNLVLDDHLATLEVDSHKVGTRGQDLDFALLVDGLQAEREQGITIDVAYRYFTTQRRQFIVADTPGHVQYTRNMATGASTADLAVILVDATRGLTTQTLRHTHLVALMGISQVILAVNKLDLVDFDQSTFESLADAYREHAEQVGITSVTAIPLCAALGDNLVSASVNTPWYDGPTLIGALESAPVADVDTGAAMRMAVQLVNRPDSTFRGFSGQVLSGRILPGDEVVVLPSQKTSTVSRIVSYDGDLDCAIDGQAVTVTLSDELDVSRGDVLADARHLPQVGDGFAARLVWMAEDALVVGRRYQLKIATMLTGATIAGSIRLIDVESLERDAVSTLSLNDIGEVEIHLDAPVVFDTYRSDRSLGAFILIDRITNETVAAGMIDAPLEAARDIHPQHLDVDAAARRGLMGHAGGVIWLTGLSGAGKSTIANALERKLHARGVHTFLLDGDNLRSGLCRDLGFSEADRVENIRRAGEVCALFEQAGLIAIAAFISPHAAERRAVRDRFDEGVFTEVFVDTPLAVAAERDPKGLYARARRGEIANFTGVDAPYERPEDAEIRIDTTKLTPEMAADAIVSYLGRTGVLDLSG